jgi:steroid 5-alpha reductase family enzyme
MLAEKTGDAYWAVSLLGIHLFPTVVVFLGMLPVLIVMQASDSVGIMDILALAVGVAAILIETVADNQLRRFVQRKEKDRGDVLQSGLWSYSRHPNYLGEIMFWLSLYLFALGCGREHWWTGVGFLAMVLLFVFISVPMMEKRQIANKPAYAEYKRRVSAILPIRRGSSR